MIPIPIFVLSINYFIDPANLFKNGRYEMEIAAASLSGKNITNISEYDERKVRKYYLEGLKTKIDILVIGSSRLLTIRQDQFPNASFYNSSVGNASLEDLITIYWLYRKKNFTPAKIIFGADPWLLNKESGHTSFKSIINDWQEASVNLSIPQTAKEPTKYIKEKYTQLASVSYFQDSFNKLIKTLQNKDEVKGFSLTDKQTANTSVMLFDGSVNFSNKLRSASNDDVREMAITYAQNNPVYGLRNFNQLDSTLKDNFQKFLNLLLSDGNEIIFYLPPYHPVTFNLLTVSDKYRIILEAEEYFKRVGIDKKIKVVGSYNPRDLNIEETEFYDAMHIKENAVEKILKDI